MSDHNTLPSSPNNPTFLRSAEMRGSNIDRRILVNPKNRMVYSSEIINFTGYPIAIQNREGLTFKLNPVVDDSPAGRTGLVIRKFIQHGANVTVTTNNALSGQNEHSPEITAVKQAYQTSVGMDKDHPSASKNIVVEYFYSIDYLMKNGLHNYLIQPDMAVTVLENDSVVPGVHPYSYGGQHAHHSKRSIAPLCNDNEVGIMYKYISNSESYNGPVYVNVNGIVLKLLAVNNDFVEAGIYVMHNEGRQVVGSSDKKSIPLDEAFEKKIVFKTRHEAEYYGSHQLEMERQLETSKAKIKEEEIELGNKKREMDEQFAIRKQEVDMELLEKRQKIKEKDIEFDRQTSENKAKLARDQADWESEKAAVEKELTRLKHENALLAEDIQKQSLERKDIYESRSLERKDTSEMIKYVPAVLTAIGGLVVWAVNSRGIVK